MAHRKVPVRDEAVLALYRELKNGPETARRLGLGSTTVYRILARNGERAVGTAPIPHFTPGRKLTPEQESEVARRYSGGEQMATLRADFDASAGLIRDIARRHGGIVRGRGGRYRAFSDAQLSEIKTLWANGDSQTNIGRAFGASQSVISNVLRGEGVPFGQRCARGAKHGRWIGGRVALGNGYIGVRVSNDDPLVSMRQRNGYVEEHRLVMARALGRVLEPRETVHHINGDKTDNRLANLQLRSGNHGKGVVVVCLDCGSHNVAARPLAEH